MASQQSLYRYFAVSRVRIDMLRTDRLREHQTCKGSRLCSRRTAFGFLPSTWTAASGPCHVLAWNLILLQDYARLRFATLTKKKLTELGWQLLYHLPYSSVMSPSDYHLFRPLDTLSEQEELKNVIIRRKGGRYLVEVAKLFETIPQLINHYRSTPGKLNKITFILKYPIKQQSWEFKHSDVQQGRLLGQGAFGEVRAGTLKSKSGRTVDVAIKVTKGCTDLGKAKIKELMKEARLMRNFQHRNILVSGGALCTFLRENANKIEVKQKLNLCLGAALGVEYLHMNHCIHRDLAARNCLLTPDRIVKISDFGLSRLGVQYQLKTAMKLPIRWLAPETITTFVFTLKTDVFSFGVLVYEIFADGAEPWDGQTNAEVKAAVIGGKCLSFPKCTPDKLKKFFVERVFAMNPANRATMTEVVKLLQGCGATQGNRSQMSEVRHSGSRRSAKK
ncbi:hypothetical protein KIN20_030364 [Parelaphostrongylus tenuis]|uniref:Protein kinase domain-containing protein n=1 Tax=Parelaphostrongylus tenuis TaxID=148309 RepID=A0AAD5R3N9_PARTN|nr:hypothetical protein KIN20_030364 [Parelaphostrongylus tenuis]